MQRKAEVDLDLRKKAEAERGEIRKYSSNKPNLSSYLPVTTKTPPAPLIA